MHSLDSAILKFSQFDFLSGLKNCINNADCVFLCIGSDKITGDCLGPLTGYLLKNTHNVNAYIYGTLDAPINALNLELAEKFIRKKHKKSKIVTIDACLGNVCDIGKIKIVNKPAIPGNAFSKNLKNVGDMSILAIVNRGTAEDNFSLFSTPLNLVYKLANLIALSVAEFLKEK